MTSTPINRSVRQSKSHLKEKRVEKKNPPNTVYPNAVAHPVPVKPAVM